MTEIWKYPITEDDEQTLAIPAGAELLCVGLDPAGAICLWAAVDPSEAAVDRRIAVAWTGEGLDGSPLDVAARYVGTARKGERILHVLDLGEPALDPGGDLSTFDALRRGETPDEFEPDPGASIDG